MDEQNELVTVFSTALETAEEEAVAVCDLLVDSGLTAVVCDDATEGVEEGSWEVRVPQAQVEQAEAILVAQDETTAIDEDPGLDFVPLFEEGTEVSEMEAISLKTLLESTGIPAMIIGASQLPSLPFEIRVPADRLEEAEEVIRQAMAAGAEE